MFLHTGNGGAVNGGAINGRGLRHRKLPHKQLVAFAADAVSGETQVELSQTQWCSVFGVSPAAMRAELKARAATRSEQASKLHRT